MKHHTHYAKTKPNAPAVIMAESGKIILWEEYNRRVNQLARYFRDIGLKEKDHIAILMENSGHYFEILDAAGDAGLLFTTISTHLKQNEIEYVINNCEAKLLIVSEGFAGMAKQTPRVKHRLILGTATDGYDSYEETITRYEGAPIKYNMSGKPMYYSSGTTGQPKGIVWDVPDYPVGTIDPTMEAAFSLFRINEETIYLSTQPLYHSAPSAFALTILQLGGTIVLMEKFEAEKALSLIEKYRVTHSQWVPTMFIRMLKLPEEIRSKYDISSLQLAIHAAAPCPVHVKEQMIQWWGPILFEYWGGTETSIVTAISSQEWTTHKGSVGKSYSAGLHILDDDGNELPPYESGLICLESGRPFSYHGEPEKTASSRNERGWSNIGDIGYLDDEGYLYLTDRKSFMIISGGVNIYPQETEDVLVMHHKVADVAVIGVPNEEFGEEVKAVVQPLDIREAGPELEKELMEFCRGRISNIKCPKSIDFMEELPRTPAGKLLKRLIVGKYNLKKNR
jgi:long-chain acyl-CoA synthetase